MKAWVTKDKDGDIFIYSEKPEKESTIWVNSGFCLPITESALGEDVNPKWEDDEPIEVKLKIERVLGCEE